MKFLLLGLLSILAITRIAIAQQQESRRYDSHPVLAYGLLRHVPADDGVQEFILNLDDDDGVVVLEQGESSSSNSKCDKQRFRRCIQQYADDLGLEEISKDSLRFVRDLKQIVEEQGVEGLKKECRAGTNLKLCLANQMESCITEDFLKSMGIREADAKVFITLAAQMAYQCTSGLDSLVRNWDCIERTERAHRRDFEQCQNDYARKVQQDPSNVCKYTQEMVNCMTTPFKQTCPPQVYGVICHSLQIGITTSLPQCKIICTKGSKTYKASADQVHTDTLSTFLARTLLENIPTHQFLAFRRRSWPLTGAQCDETRFKRCANSFVKNVGLPSFPKRASALAVYLNQLIATQKAAGFEKVCSAAKTLATCLGDQIESCFTTQHLEALGIPPSDVLIYREMQAALASECGSGYDVIHEKVDCMIECAEQHPTEFGRCATDFQRNVQRDPSHVCDYSQTFLRCNSDLFQQGCGDELSSAVCNAMKAELQVPLPTCRNLTCMSDEDVALVEGGANDLLSGRHAAQLLDVLGDLPASQLRQQMAAAAALLSTTPATADDSSSSDSDEQQQQPTETENEEATPEDDSRAKCNDRKFGRCVKTYAKQLGMKSFPQDPMEFAAALNALIQKYGKIGFKKICTSGAKLGRCLGRQQIGACITLEHLQELGLTKQQALAYIVITKTLAFECTKGYKVIFNNFDCILNATSSSNSTFVKCGKDFAQKVKKDPKNVCKYTQGLVNCDVKPFAQKCNRQVSTTICQLMQIQLKTFLPKCPIKCGRQDQEDQEDDGDQDDVDEIEQQEGVPMTRIRQAATRNVGQEDRVADLIAS